MNKNIIKPKNFRETEIGRIPNEWEAVRLSDIFEVITGTTPSTKNPDYWNNATVNWFTPADMTDITGQAYLTESRRKITKKGVEDTTLTVMPPGSIIISTRAPVGYVGILTAESVFNQGCKGLMPKKDKRISPEFYYYYLASIEKKLQNMSSGSTFMELGKDALEKCPIIYLDYSEQQKIASILSTVDEAIQKSDQILVKTERLKKGLMHKLLMQGIGHTEFKDTEIGKIPKEWELKEVQDIISLEYGENLTENKRSGTGFPVFGSNGIVGHHSTALVNGPGVVVGRKGSIGEVNWSDIDFWPIDTTYYVSLKNLPLNLKWIYYKLMFLRLKRLNSATGTPGLNRDLVYRIKIPFPPILEQQKIAEILSTVDEKLEKERKRKEKLERIKRALMNDLLTGKKRVK